MSKIPCLLARAGRVALLGGAAFALPSLPAAAAPAQTPGWLVVAQGPHERIEIDTSRIGRSRNGTLAWSRIQLGQSVKDPAGSYDTIEAQNLYDCDAGRFTTLKRAYFRGETKVREEPVLREKANRIAPGSIDDRLWQEACRPRTAGDAQNVAELAARVMTDAQSADRPTPMHADMRSLGSEGGGRILPVADAGATNRIQLPPIDKAAAAAASAAVQAGASPTPAAPAAPALPAAARPAGPMPAVPSYAAPQPAAKVVEPRPVPRAAELAAAAENRRTRELLLATSGPRKAATKPATKKEEAANPAQQMHAHWGYDGAGGPAHWGSLKPDYATCANGKRQSPIDIREGIKVDLEPIKFDYKPTKFRIVDNGHTVQVNVGAGSTIQVMGKRYELVQFHFHKPSEERINGRPFDMVIHFVHKDYDDNLAVIAVLLETGGEHPQLQTVWNNMPLEPNMELLSNDTLDTIRLFPENRAYWTYMGSLTTPPCTENVLWMVMKQPQQISAEQVAIFARLYKNNARPVQPANGRLVKESR